MFYYTKEGMEKMGYTFKNSKGTFEFGYAVQRRYCIDNNVDCRDTVNVRLKDRLWYVIEKVNKEFDGFIEFGAMEKC